MRIVCAAAALLMLTACSGQPPETPACADDAVADILPGPCPE